MTSFALALADIPGRDLQHAGNAPLASNRDAQLTVRVAAEESTGRVKVYRSGTFRWPNGDVYIGDMVDGVRTGEGTLKYNNDTNYTGQFEAGRYEGRGTLRRSAFWRYGVLHKGETYSGEWHGGLRHGKGTLVVGNGDVYDGDFNASHYHGSGVMRYADGRKYDGEWQHGKWHGHGCLDLASGDAYEGRFHNNDFDGQGRYRHFGSGSYNGGWRRGMHHGIGRRMWASGAEYEGEWAEGRMCGRGIYRSPKGDVCIGMFRDDQPHGKGTILYASGDTYQGTLVRGRFCGSGRFTHSSGGGGYFEGEFLSLCRTGIPACESLSAAQRELKRAAREAVYARRPWLSEEEQEERELQPLAGGASTGLGAPTLALTKRRSSVTSVQSVPAVKRDAASAVGSSSGSGSAFGGGRGRRGSSMGLPKAKKARAPAYSVPAHLRAKPITGRIIVGSAKDAKLQASVRGDANATAAVAPPRLTADGKRHGRGVRVWASGARYEGEWFQDDQQGFGVYICPGPTGMRYEGAWTAGRRGGYGVCSYGNAMGGAFACPLGFQHRGTDGRCVYDGHWDRDAFHGEGTFTCCDGRQHVGQWRHGVTHGPGQRVVLPKAHWVPLPDYRNPLSAPALRPVAVIQTALKNRIPLDALDRIRVTHGTWVDGLQQGPGRALLNRGDVLEGDWLDGAVHGRVQLTYVSGRTTVAQYHRGVCKRAGMPTQ